MTSRFAYDQPFTTVEEFEEAIAEAYGQAESLDEHSERLRAEADRWYDRAYTLEIELENLEDSATVEIELNQDFFNG